MAQRTTGNQRPDSLKKRICMAPLYRRYRRSDFRNASSQDTFRILKDQDGGNLPIAVPSLTCSFEELCEAGSKLTGDNHDYRSSK